MEYWIYGPDGSCLQHPVRAFAVGDDNSDKGPGKALSYAYKSAISQLFCIPTDDPSMDNEHAPPAEATPLAAPEDVAALVAMFDVLPAMQRGQAKQKWSTQWGAPTALDTSQIGPATKMAAVIVDAFGPPPQAAPTPAAAHQAAPVVVDAATGEVVAPPEANGSQAQPDVQQDPPGVSLAEQLNEFMLQRAGEPMKTGDIANELGSTVRQVNTLLKKIPATMLDAGWVHNEFMSDDDGEG